MNARRQMCLLLGGMSLVLLAACNEDGTMAQSAGSAPMGQVAANGTAREVCTDEVVETPKEVKDEKQVLGTVAGAVVGGAVGHELGGSGKSQDAATVAGAIAGGYAGNRVQNSVQENATEKTTQRVCRTVYD